MKKSKCGRFSQICLLFVMLFAATAKGATEEEVIKNIQKAEYIYVVRGKDGKAFMLLDKLKLGRPNVTEVQPYLNLGFDALCLKGDFKNAFFIIHPVFKNNIYFTNIADRRKIPQKDIIEVFKKTKVDINFANLDEYVK